MSLFFPPNPPPKSVSVEAIESAFSQALSKLAGESFSVSIQSISYQTGEIHLVAHQIEDDDKSF
jgi:hypothetical protein